LICSLTVAVRLPVKQGLKLTQILSAVTNNPVAVRLPVKQGLKLLDGFVAAGLLAKLQ